MLVTLLCYVCCNLLRHIFQRHADQAATRTSIAIIEISWTITKRIGKFGGDEAWHILQRQSSTPWYKAHTRHMGDMYPYFSHSQQQRKRILQRVVCWWEAKCHAASTII
jgi:hypothetical protein